jgi:ATP-dependent 26S proteasome regulatory subunit
MQNQQTNSMDLIKSQMLTMLMVNNMNSKNNDNSMTNTIYLLIITQFIDLIIKYIPALSSFIYLKYISHYVNTYKDTINTVITENNILKTKRSSITLTIRIGDQDNVIGQSLMDFVTNCKNTTHVSYKNKNFMMNQTSVVEIAPDIFAILTKSTDIESSSTSSSSSSSQPMPTQLLEIYSFEKTVDELRTFLDSVTQNYVLTQKNKLGNSKCYFNMVPRFALKIMGNNGVQKKDFSRLPTSMTFSMKRFSTNRKFSNLFGEDIDIIKNRVNFFINNREWYNEKGIPYSLGLLLSGKPGTGKTSTIKCLAHETRRHIFNINLNNDITKQQLENLFFNEMVQVEVGEPYCIPLDQRIYVLEDIDCQSDLVRQRTEMVSNTENDDVHKIDLSFLLNLLDGVLEMPGRIIIMTSNFPNLLDTALVRPGRIDIIAKFTCCSFDTIIKMLEFFYDTVLTDEQCKLIRQNGEFKITPAEMSRIMFENFGNIDGAIEKYKDFSGDLDKQQVEPNNDSHIPEVIDATANNVDATANNVDATADASAEATESNEYKFDDVNFLKYLNMNKDEIDANPSIRESFNKEMEEYYYKTSPNYFNDNKHILCSPIPVECLVKESLLNLSQETYSTLDNGNSISNRASAYS